MLLSPFPQSPPTKPVSSLNEHNPGRKEQKRFLDVNASHDDWDRTTRQQFNEVEFRAQDIKPKNQSSTTSQTLSK